MSAIAELTDVLVVPVRTDHQPLTTAPNGASRHDHRTDRAVTILVGLLHWCDREEIFFDDLVDLAERTFVDRIDDKERRASSSPRKPR